ncbi:hypothetical protein LSP04_08330 [Levilactobacillus spicheri]|uniref:Uncharacterized protein n=1 Tax=Levilactobacillus spicheri TaxID=216463 RepID=A0ABQ0WQU5_9LACO|nr:hypothetical protein LSP04_08330 [Levilactobacillus spicheri]
MSSRFGRYRPTPPDALLGFTQKTTHLLQREWVVPKVFNYPCVALWKWFAAVSAIPFSVTMSAALIEKSNCALASM